MSNLSYNIWLWQNLINYFLVPLCYGAHTGFDFRAASLSCLMKLSLEGTTPFTLAYPNSNSALYPLTLSFSIILYFSMYSVLNTNCFFWTTMLCTSCAWITPKKMLQYALWGGFLYFWGWKSTAEVTYGYVYDYYDFDPDFVHRWRLYVYAV